VRYILHSEEMVQSRRHDETGTLRVRSKYERIS
jgi:hypothetical protein